MFAFSHFSIPMSSSRSRHRKAVSATAPSTSSKPVVVIRSVDLPLIPSRAETVKEAYDILSSAESRAAKRLSLSSSQQQFDDQGAKVQHGMLALLKRCRCDSFKRGAWKLLHDIRFFSLVFTLGALLLALS